jgi:hypothetical protein
MPIIDPCERFHLHLLLCDWRGIYIPQDFAIELRGWAREIFSETDIPEAALNLLAQGPDEDNYWEVWDDVLSAIGNDSHQRKVTLCQNGDLFALTQSPTGAYYWPEDSDSWEEVP